MNKTQRTQIAKQLRAAAQKLSAQSEKYAVVDFSDNPRRGYIVSLHKDQGEAQEKARQRGPRNLVTLTSRKVGNSIMMDEMDAGDDVEAASKVKAKTKVRAASGKPGSLKDGIWQGEVVSEKSTLTDILESLDQDHLAKLMSDTMGLFDSDYVPDAKDLANQNRSKVPDEAITVFADAASNAYRSAWENAAEGYFVKTVTENLISLLNDASGTAQYTGEDTDGEEVEVEVDFDVTAKETGDVDGVFSNPYIEVTITNPGHLSNYAEWVLSGERTTAAPVDQPGEALSALSGLLMMLKSESSREVKNVGDVNTDNSDMDWDLFQENFESNVLEMAPDDIAEAIQTYANDSEESVEDVVDMVMKDIPGLSKMSGAIASALEGGYDARQQKLPLSSAVKALAAAEAAIKAAGNPIANIREKRSAAAKRGDGKAVSFWNEKLRNALSKGPAPSSTTKSKALSGGTVKAAAPKVTPKQFAGYKKAERDGGVTFNDGYNVPTFGITQAVFNVISKCISTMAGSSHSSNASLAEINKLLAGEKVQLARADQKLLDQAAQALSASVSAARKLTPNQQKKLDSKRIEQAYYKVADGVQIDMMDIGKVFKVGEAAIAQGADDAALETAIDKFVTTIRKN